MTNERIFAEDDAKRVIGIKFERQGRIEKAMHSERGEAILYTGAIGSPSDFGAIWNRS